MRVLSLAGYGVGFGFSILVFQGFRPGFPGIRGIRGIRGIWGFGSFRASCCVSMHGVIMCQLFVRACKTLQINKWSGLFTPLSNDLIATKAAEDAAAVQAAEQACFGCLSLSFSLMSLSLILI